MIGPLNKRLGCIFSFKVIIPKEFRGGPSCTGKNVQIVLLLLKIRPCMVQVICWCG